MPEPAEISRHHSTDPKKKSRAPKILGFHEKVRSPNTPMVLYELIPPAQGISQDEIDLYAQCAIDLTTTARIPIDAINIPEIRQEDGNRQKMDAREFGAALKARARQMPIVVNRVTVHEQLNEQLDWLRHTMKSHQIDSIVLVGPERNQTQFIGPSVNQMAKTIKDLHTSAVLVGGICIPTRKDEPARLAEKARHGIEFFTSQVLYETELTKELLINYDGLCKKRELAPKPIFLSFAPISTAKDVNFLQWLGVAIPQETQEKLLKTDFAMGWRSLKICAQNLAEILSFAKKNRLTVPIGLNIEHITRHNFELSRDFLEELGHIYYDYFNALTEPT